MQSICDYLQIEERTSNIHDNKEGCNSESEIEAACLTNVDLLPTNLIIYPNPVQDIIYITSPVITNLIILNYTGKIMKSLLISAGTNEIDISDFCSGIYFFKTELGLGLAQK